MNVWELITSASNLSVQAGTTLWDHLNDLCTGGTGNGGSVPVLVQTLGVNADSQSTVTVHQDRIEVEAKGYGLEITIEQSEIGVSDDV